MANMNNEIFAVLRKNQFLAIFRDFFAGVSKKRKQRYLKNGCTNFLDFFTDTSYNELLLNELKDKQLKHYLPSFTKKFENYFFLAKMHGQQKNCQNSNFQICILFFNSFDSY